MILAILKFLQVLPSLIQAVKALNEISPNWDSGLGELTNGINDLAKAKTYQEKAAALDRLARSVNGELHDTKPNALAIADQAGSAARRVATLLDKHD